MNFTFTLDLEDHRANEKYPKRYPENTRKLLKFLQQQKIKATVFTVGKIAEQDPGLIKEISELGHELAFHSYHHRHLTLELPNKFRNETASGKKLIEDITGKPVIGFRAPVFSLTPESQWVLDILKELDFEYSSSVIPAKNPLYGFPGLPSSPFYWPNGLLEIPVPISKMGLFTIPYLGGFYLRYLPLFMIQHCINKEQGEKHLWSYCHPYDFDADESFFRIKGASLLVSLLLWFNRRNTYNKIDCLLSILRDNYEIMTFSEHIRAGSFQGTMNLPKTT